MSIMVLRRVQSGLTESRVKVMWSVLSMSSMLEDHLSSVRMLEQRVYPHEVHGTWTQEFCQPLLSVILV